MRLTRGRLLKQDDWTDWQDSEYLQLNQYDSQGMFGNPVLVNPDDADFHLVWTYNVKALDGRKKARCVCNGSSRSGSVQVLDETYATVSTKPARVCFMPLLPPKISLSTVLTSVTPSLRHHLQNKVSTYAPTGPFTNGGNTTKVDLPSHPDMQSLSCQQCKVTPNLPVCGKSMRILFFVILVSHLRCTNHASTLVLSMEFVSSS